MSLDIDVKFNEDNNSWVVYLKGELDIYTSPELKETLIDALDKKDGNIIINGKNLDYVDSTGLGVLISILKRVREKDNNVYLQNIKPNIRKLFDITKLDKVFIFKE
ncbi:anti-sigma B factor antagonist [Keratinibaculum paraultunense]|uniref:Anti-sigma factor antagonist n=1 Tax=Keratinibaculum paraultunense TaxID=1278232 RepID=A0A4R3KQX2_9FIRM|nr:STAS domain-containing protein [Keratinibaculum paraultunense]QQY79770.1 STAS domain-containing protein [Keratinibaculum paraultunense]TCS86920.1 anti-sigma B factor antagonist [Keratinibaculum paraultunense]